MEIVARTRDRSRLFFRFVFLSFVLYAYVIQTALNIHKNYQKKRERKREREREREREKERERVCQFIHNKTYVCKAKCIVILLPLSSLNISIN